MPADVLVTLMLGLLAGPGAGHEQGGQPGRAAPERIDLTASAASMCPALMQSVRERSISRHAYIRHGLYMPPMVVLKHTPLIGIWFSA
ncbi:MAG: hypothetical protein HEQ39_19170 [Rhizobacter sp.]